MELKANTIYRIMKSNLNRNRGYITLTGIGEAFITKEVYQEPEMMLENGFPLYQQEIHDIGTYKGDMYIVATMPTEIRVLEY
jgi:hypothetical protein